MPSVIELAGLSVRFGKREILKDLSAALSGHTLGLLGPNGAGKSTLIQTLLGFCPVAGVVLMSGGYVVAEGRIRGVRSEIQDQRPMQFLIRCRQPNLLASRLFEQDHVVEARLLPEGINPFLPAALKKISMIYYLQSLCPVAAAPGQDVPGLVHLLISPVQPATRSMAVLSIVILTGVVLVAAARLSRRMEINYSTE